MPRVLEVSIERAAVSIAAITRASLRHPGLTLGLTAGLCVWLVLGVLKLEQLSSLLGFLPRDHPAVVRYDRFLDEFMSDETILIAVSCAPTPECRRVLEPARVRQMGQLEDRLGKLQGVAHVSSLVSVPFLDATGDDLAVRRLGEVAPGDPAAFEELGSRMLADPAFVGSVISEDADTAALVVQFPARTLSERERGELVLELLSMLEAFEAETGMTTFAVGQPVASALSNQNTRNDLRLLVPLMFLVVVAAFLWVFRSVVAALAPLVCVAAATLLAFGLMGHLNVPVTVVSSILPILIVVIGVTDSMHLMTRYFYHRDRAVSSARALEEAARELGVPSLVTALTGSLGLISFLLGPMVHLGEFGVFAAIGIGGGFLATFTLLPVLVQSWPPRARRRPNLELGERVLDSIHAFSTRRWGLLLVLGCVCAALAGVGLSSIKVQNDLFQILDESDYIFRSEVFVSEQLRHTRTRELVFQSREGKSLWDPGALDELALAERALLESPYVSRVDSILVPLRRVDSLLNLNPGEPAQLPKSPGEIEESLFLLESADPDLLGSLLSIDRKVVRLSIPWPILDSRTNLEVGRDLERVVTEAAPNWSVSTTGISDLNALLSELVLWTQVNSFSGAFLTILVVLTLLIGSIRLGLLGMIPNLLPIVVLLGLMGYWGILLDIGTAMVATILIGISVDDTVYFLLHYRNARKRGEDVSGAVRFSFGFSGNAAMFSTVILASGFMLLGFSEFQALAYLGILSALAVVLAVVSELFLLPAVLVAADRIRGRWIGGRRFEGDLSDSARTRAPASSSVQ